MSSGPVVPMVISKYIYIIKNIHFIYFIYFIIIFQVWEGLNAVKTGRYMLGETNPKDSAPGTIRGDFCIQVGRNIIHGSDSVESANKEINLWFGEEKEVIDWTSWAEKWIYE